MPNCLQPAPVLFAGVLAVGRCGLCLEAGKPEARKMFENAAESPAFRARYVGSRTFCQENGKLRLPHLGVNPGDHIGEIGFDPPAPPYDAVDSVRSPDDVIGLRLIHHRNISP